ncbi:hypothetical protein [Hippea maritima]|uniref:Uncharacterized protein n=1 Tax=Hippea maritima (strain ATCC 700847 / DSM 10411 / MH2) TaxID=760142 RepID=F2LWL2_HIPMA|nr:hypothetical protein [Hippea maritima]AEA34121.1 hypothetical protein Hipma_1158 [Hippea maritima DSM 10411]
MLWFVAVIFTIVAVIIGVKRWKMANDPMYAVDVKNRKAWVREVRENSRLISDSEIEDISEIGVRDTLMDDVAYNPAFEFHRFYNTKYY